MTPNAKKFDEAMKEAAKALQAAQEHLGVASDILGNAADDGYATGTEKYSFLHTAHCSGQVMQAVLTISDVATRIRAMRRTYGPRITN